LLVKLRIVIWEFAIVLAKVSAFCQLKPKKYGFFAIFFVVLATCDLKFLP